jgi:hypothetical protein
MQFMKSQSSNFLPAIIIIYLCVTLCLSVSVVKKGTTVAQRHGGSRRV